MSLFLFFVRSIFYVQTVLAGPFLFFWTLVLVTDSNKSKSNEATCESFATAYNLFLKFTPNALKTTADNKIVKTLWYNPFAKLGTKMNPKKGEFEALAGFQDCLE